MVEKGILNKVDGFQSSPKSLSEEIKIDLKRKGVDLTKNQEIRLLHILENRFFKETILTTRNREMIPQDINAVNQISYILAATAIAFHFEHMMFFKNLEREEKKQRREYARGVDDSEVKEPPSSNPIS